MKNKPKLCRFLFSALAVLFWLAVWEIASLLVHLELLLPSPVRVAERLLALAGETEFWAAAGGSMLRLFSCPAYGALRGSACVPLSRCRGAAPPSAEHHQSRSCGFVYPAGAGMDRFSRRTSLHFIPDGVSDRF